MEINKKELKKQAEDLDKWLQGFLMLITMKLIL